MAEPMIRIDNLHKYFGELEVLKGVDMEVCKGEVIVILGPSGSGKSTLLRCVNRLEELGTPGVFGVRVDERLIRPATLLGARERNRFRPERP